MKLTTKIFAFGAIILLPCLAQAEFKLKDFVGSYTSYSSSAGGSTNPAGSSVASVAQFTLDKCGNGKVNFVNGTLYSLSSGSNSALVFENSAPLAIEFFLTDPHLGVGTATAVDVPFVGNTLSTRFVATKSARRGSVVEILFNVTGNTVLPFTSPTTIIAHRQ